MNLKTKKSLRCTAVNMIKKLRSEGYQAFFAGGCVRDMLLGRPPKDYDIATSALPHEVEKLFKHTIAVGKAFGVIRVRLDGHEIEVATFRTDEIYHDGRHPSRVQFSTAQEDVQRRDFTVNGLFYDPIQRTVLDFVGGQSDLRKGILRAIGNPKKRFQEDHLRLLRGIRFVAQLGFKMEPKTRKALTVLASKIRFVSAERVRDELNKLLLAPDATKGLRLLSRCGLMRWLLPEIEAMHGVPQPRAYHPEGDVFVHTLRVIDQLDQPDVRLVWAALLHDVGKPPTFEKSCVRGRIRIRFPEHARVGAKMAGKILRRLRFSNADREMIVEMVANHMTFKDVKAMRLSTLKRLLARFTFNEELALHRADCMASHRNLGNIRFLRRRLKEISLEEIKPPKLIGGKDLIKLGLKPGPLFGQILKAIEEAQLEGRIHTHEEAIDFVKKNIL